MSAERGDVKIPTIGGDDIPFINPDIIRREREDRYRRDNPGRSLNIPVYDPFEQPTHQDKDPTHDPFDITDYGRVDYTF